MTKDSEIINQARMTMEFLEKLAKLTIEYRTEITLGSLVGALEIVKDRLLMESHIAFGEEMKKGKE